ncbi:YqiA/YcfP family alpha/beta fold hydrolase [Mailhella sp.]
MDRFVYIHGFNSGRNSHSGRGLSEVLGQPVICPEYDYSKSFSECLASIRQQISEAIDEQNDRLTIMGSSLGGFFALQLRHPAIAHVCAWNPVIYPAIQLEQFLGRNTRFSDGAEWEFTREALLSYAQAPDPRPWRNEMWLREQRRAKGEAALSQPCFELGGRGFTLLAGDRGESLKGASSAGSPAEREAKRLPRRDIFLASRDELLDSRLARAFWQGHADLHSIDSGHQIFDYSHAAEILKSAKMLDSFAGWESGAAWASPFREAALFSMAALFAPGEKLDDARRLLWLADVPYLEMQGRKNGAPFPLAAVFFHPRHEERTRRLIAGLVKSCGRHSYALLSADGKALRHQCAANRLQDAEYALPLEGRSFAAAVHAAFPGWQADSSEWHARERHGSMNRAMIRAHFAQLWGSCEDPVAAFEGGIRND